jgi:O-antigen/teichoic acid export membrane protein
MPLYTSQLTAEQYGVAELLSSSIEIVLPTVTLCIVDALFRFSIDEDVDHKKIMSASINIVIRGFVFLAFVCTIFYYVTNYMYTYYFYFLYVATVLHKLFSQFARGLGHVRRYAISGIINALALVVMNIIMLVIFNGGIEAYLSSLIISHFAAALFSFLASKEYLYVDVRTIDKALLKSMLVFSIPNVPNMLSWWVNNISGRYVILVYCGTGVAGMYTAASKIPSMINMATTIFQQAWQYSTAKEIKNTDGNSFFSIVFRYYSAGIFLVSSGLIALIPFLSRLILRGNFYDAWVYVPLLIVSATLGSFSTYFGTFYAAIKNNVMSMISTGLGAIISVIVNVLLVPTIGVYGVLISSVLGYFLITIIRIYDTRKYVSLSINYRYLSLRFSIVLMQAIVLTTGSRFAKIFSLVCFCAMLALHTGMIVDLFRGIRYLFWREKHDSGKTIHGEN